MRFIFHSFFSVILQVVSFFYLPLDCFLIQILDSPNSCGQVQAADIGIMGAPARKLNEETGKMMAVPGCKIFVGGRIGEDAHLALDPFKSDVPLEDVSLIPELVEILKSEFGAVDKKSRKRDVLKRIIGISS